MAGDRRSDRNNGGEGSSNSGTGLSREDLMAIATIVARTLQGLVNPNNNNQSPPLPPPLRGTKFYYESLRKNKAPTFDGSYDPEVAQTCMKNIETQLQLLEVPDAFKVDVVTPLLDSKAGKWWEAVEPTMTSNGQVTVRVDAQVANLWRVGL
ncbi:hypothetical protein F511_42024 [Dorcoceras hygrometricum]|uniref:Uncharacterized protein n=1 Tax=Dorcoceras hygrometricum TaxID=472368 RepID=A0A2Z7BID3_9LAMI|nr:hypothetical protein F511_42024 [Dorcoceras hygrometricum]